MATRKIKSNKREDKRNNSGEKEEAIKEKEQRREKREMEEAITSEIKKYFNN